MQDKVKYKATNLIFDKDNTFPNFMCKPIWED